MHPYHHTMFAVETARKDTEKKQTAKCLIFGPNLTAKKEIVDHNIEHEDGLSVWLVEDQTVRRSDLLAQYIAYHKPDWLVYTPDVQTHASMDSCTLQLVRLLGIARQEQIRLAVLVKTLKCSFVETFMEFVPWHGEHMHGESMY